MLSLSLMVLIDETQEETRTWAESGGYLGVEREVRAFAAACMSPSLSIQMQQWLSI